MVEMTLKKSRESRGWQARKDRPRAELMRRLVAEVLTLPPEQVADTGLKDPWARQGRWLSYYMAHIGWGWSMERVGLAFDVSRTTVSEACRRVEDARDEPGLDACLERLEQCLAALPRLDRPQLAAPAGSGSWGRSGDWA